jgi:hypothetical protein
VAWNPNPVASIALFFRDDDGAESTHIVNVPISALSGAKGFAKDYALLVSRVSACALEKIRVTVTCKPDSSYKAATGSYTKRQSILLFDTERDQIYVVAIPGLIAAKVMQTGTYAGVQLDSGDADIAALASMLINGNGQVRPVAPWNPGNGGTSEWEWDGVLLAQLHTAYWGYEQPGWY